jgi:hypothetical protein
VALVKSDEDTLTTAIVELYAQEGRYGYRRVTGLIRVAGPVAASLGGFLAWFWFSRWVQEGLIQSHMFPQTGL